MAIVNGTSNALITDLQTVFTTGPNPQTVTNVTAPAGVLLDFAGNVQGCMQGLTDVKRRIIELLKDVDTTQPDPVLAILQGVANTLV